MRPAVMLVPLLLVWAAIGQAACGRLGFDPLGGGAGSGDGDGGLLDGGVGTEIEP